MVGLHNPMRQSVHTNLPSVLSDPNSGITFLAPGDVIGAGSSHKDLEQRFSSDDLRDPIIHDNSKQDEQLRTQIDKHRLPHWFEACREEAKKLLEEEAEARLEEEKALNDVQKSMTENESSKAIEGANGGHVNGGTKHMAEQEDDSFGDGDGESQAGEHDAESLRAADEDGDMEMS